MTKLKLKKSYYFSDQQIKRVLESLGLKGRKGRKWIKRLQVINVAACMEEVIRRLVDPIWMNLDELEDMLLKPYISKNNLHQIVVNHDPSEDIEAYITHQMYEDLESYMDYLSTDKTLYRYIWDRHSLRLNKGIKSTNHDFDTQDYFRKHYKQLTIRFNTVIQYRVLVFYLLYQEGFSQNFEKVITEGLLKRQVFEKEIRAYEGQNTSEVAINRYWAYSMFSKMILAGQEVNKSSISTVLSTYKYLRKGGLDDSILRVFDYDANRKLSIDLQRPKKNGNLPFAQWMSDYFKNQADQQRGRIEASSDETTYVLYMWMYDNNPWRFLMYNALLKHLNMDLQTPCLKDLQVFRLVMAKLNRWERLLSQRLIDDYDQYIALTYYKHMRLAESEKYLDDLLAICEDSH